MTWARMGDFACFSGGVFNVLSRHDIQPFLVVFIDDIHGNSPCRLPVTNARCKRQPDHSHLSYDHTISHPDGVLRSSLISSAVKGKSSFRNSFMIAVRRGRVILLQLNIHSYFTSIFHLFQRNCEWSLNQALVPRHSISRRLPRAYHESKPDRSLSTSQFS